MKENSIDLNEIVKIEQMPIVFEQLEKIGTLIEKSTKDLDELECTEANKQEVKNRRTEINKTLEVLEDKRKEIQNKLLEPYNVFVDKYNKECKIKLQNASNLLKEKIDTIETQQKLEKENELREFFKQHCIDKGIDGWFSFESFNYPITLSASMKSLKEKVLQDLESIEQALKLIELEEFGDEILLEYKQNKDFSKSKLDVIERHKQLEELKNKQENIQDKIQEEEKIVEKVEEVVAPKEIIEDTEVITVQFTITDTKEKILKLRDYLKENGINYE